MTKIPMWAKLLLAKMLIKSLKDMTNDIVLFNELKLWIDTKEKPQTSNVNHWINK